MNKPVWEFYPGSHVQAALSCWGDYVISHRPRQFTVSYRPPGKHVHVGTGETLKEAQSLAAQHWKAVIA